MQNKYLTGIKIVFDTPNHGKIIGFEYDEAKSRINQEKHGICFEEAQELWADKHLTILKVERKGEKRRMAIARYAGAYWAAIYTERSGRVRLISVRRATITERRLYDKAY